MSLICKTRHDSSAEGKQKAFLFFHPEDSYLPPVICKEVLKHQDCAMFYPEPEQYKDVEFVLLSDLLDMNLIIFVVSERFIQDSSFKIEKVIDWAKQYRKPILPILVEEGLSASFNTRFKGVHYLKKYDSDSTAIPYNVKLKRFLNAVFLNDEQTEKIRKSFDAYIFISYRKKDRAEARQLMSTIHKNSYFDSVATWYDEYLIPGEKYMTVLEDKIDSSQLFLLAVTPNLVEEDNFVSEKEYPYARKTGKKIIVTNAFRKKGDKLPEQEKTLAINNMANYYLSHKDSMEE